MLIVDIEQGLNFQFLSGVMPGSFIMGFSLLSMKRVSHKGEMSHTK